MSPNTQLSEKEALFFERNDLHIFANNELFFGFRTGPDITWGNLSACMNAIILLDSGPSYFFRPRGSSSAELIALDTDSREIFGNCKEYDLLFIYSGMAPSHVKRDKIHLKRFLLRPKISNKANTPSMLPTYTVSDTPFPMTPSGSCSSISTESTPINTQSQAHGSHTAHHSSEISSPMQNQTQVNRAAKAPQRCWEMYEQCCITSTGPLVEGHTSMPPDIIAAHIFPYAYRDYVDIFLQLLFH